MNETIQTAAPAPMYIYFYITSFKKLVEMSELMSINGVETTQQLSLLDKI